MMYNVAQIHLATENYEGAVKALRRWFRATNERTPHAYYLLAVAYYQQGKLDKALRPARQAVKISEKPNQSWLQMLVGLYLQEAKYQEALPYVEVLVAHFPKKMYYLQLSALYAQLGEEEKALAVMQLAYEQGFLTLDRELVRLGEMYLYHGLPYRAAVLLEKGLEEEKVEPKAKTLEVLANAWLMARETNRAVEPLILAADLAEAGDVYVRLGQVYLEREEWGAAADALSKGLERGVKDEGDAQLLLGITYYNEKKLKSARSAFRAAREFEDNKEHADDWIRMLDRDEKRAAEEAASAS
jgi:tetratricopeptide (TPR) repeat protein